MVQIISIRAIFNILSCPNFFYGFFSKFFGKKWYSKLENFFAYNIQNFLVERKVAASFPPLLQLCHASDGLRIAFSRHNVYFVWTITVGPTNVQLTKIGSIERSVYTVKFCCFCLFLTLDQFCYDNQTERSDNKNKNKYFYFARRENTKILSIVFENVYLRFVCCSSHLVITSFNTISRIVSFISFHFLFFSFFLKTKVWMCRRYAFYKFRYIEMTAKFSTIEKSEKSTTSNKYSFVSRLIFHPFVLIWFSLFFFYFFVACL